MTLSALFLHHFAEVHSAAAKEAIEEVTVKQVGHASRDLILALTSDTEAWPGVHKEWRKLLNGTAELSYLRRRMRQIGGDLVYAHLREDYGLTPGAAGSVVECLERSGAFLCLLLFVRCCFLMGHCAVVKPVHRHVCVSVLINILMRAVLQIRPVTRSFQKVRLSSVYSVVDPCVRLICSQWARKPRISREKCRNNAA